MARGLGNRDDRLWPVCRYLRCDPCEHWGEIAVKVKHYSLPIDSETGLIGCPACYGECCDNDFVHIGPVSVRQKEYETIVGPRGARVVANDETPGRGSVVTIEFACEAGHRFDVEYRFNKGQAFFTTTIRNDDGEFQELWRD